MPDIATIRAVVHGRVQGVGFRFSVTRFARARGIRGWVRNRPDGTVEVLATGNRRDIDELGAWLDEGPGAARVDRVEVTPGETPEMGPGFEVRF